MLCKKCGSHFIGNFASPCPTCGSAFVVTKGGDDSEITNKTVNDSDLFKGGLR